MVGEKWGAEKPIQGAREELLPSIGRKFLLSCLWISSHSQNGSLYYPTIDVTVLPNWEDMVRVIGRERLSLLRGESRETAKWVSAWLAELRDAHWKRPADVIIQFPKAKPQRDGSFLFPVPKQEKCIHVLVAFSQGLALVLAITVLKATNGH